MGLEDREMTRGERWMLAAMIVVGLLVRAPRLGESLWYDEIAAWRDYGMRGPVAAVTTYYDPANHVAHTLLTSLSVPWLSGLLGQDLALRAPALLFSLLAIPAVFALGRHAGGPRAGLLAAAVAALAPVAVLEGVEARGYSMMIFFTAAAGCQLVRALDGGGPGRWCAYGALCALGVWSHPTTVFLPIGHAVWLGGRVVRTRDVRLARQAAIGLGAGAALTLVLYAPILDDVARMRSMFGGGGAGGGRVPSPFGVEGLHALFQLGGSWWVWAALPGLAAAALGLAAALREDRMRRVVLPGLLGLPIMAVALDAAGSWMYARFALFTLPAACVLIALGVLALRRRGRGLAAALLVLLAAGYAGDLVTRPPKQPLRDAADWVRARWTEGDHLLVVGLRHQVMDVYAGDMHPAYSLRLGLDLPEQLDRVRPDWIIVLYPRSVGPDRLHRLTDRGYHEVARFPGWVDWSKGSVEVWGREGTKAQRAR